MSAPGHESLTAQLYFPGDPHNADDIASAVKPELMLDPQPRPDGSEAMTYYFVLDPVGPDMLYHVRMDVRIPDDMDPQRRSDLVNREKRYPRTCSGPASGRTSGGW